MKTFSRPIAMLLSMILLCVVQTPASAQLSADTDGDGKLDVVTVVNNGIQIVHGGTGITKLYPYSGINFSLTTIKDTDGIPGDEIIGIWTGAGSFNGIHVIHDRTGTTNNYQQNRQFSISSLVDTDGEPGNEIIVIWAGGAVDINGIQVIRDRTQTTSGSSYQQNRQFSISGVSDTDGQPGNEIIVLWTGVPGVNGIQIIRDRTQTTSGSSYQQNRQFSINSVSDTDGKPGNEIIVIWDGGAVDVNGIQVIRDRTQTTSGASYQQNRQFSISGVSDTDGRAGNEIIVIWAGEIGTNGIEVIHDDTITRNNYAINTTFTIGGINDYDGISGAEICYSWFSGTTRFSLIIDRTRTIQATSSCSVTGVDENTLTPGEYFLSQNYPNPFNPSTTIRYAIPKAGIVTLKVYNLLGKEIATLLDERKPAGEYAIQWNPVDLASGIYLVRIQAGEFTASRKLLLVK